MAKFPFSADGIFEKSAVCPYASGLKIGDKRLKSTPNFKLCEPFWKDELSTILNCRITLCPPLPTSRVGPVKLCQVSKPFWEVKGLGKGSDVKGTAPPKLSKWNKLDALVLL